MIEFPKFDPAPKNAFNITNFPLRPKTNLHFLGYGEASWAAGTMLDLYWQGRKVFSFKDMTQDMEKIGLIILLDNRWIERYSYGAYHGNLQFTEKFWNRYSQEIEKI